MPLAMRWPHEGVSTCAVRLLVRLLSYMPLSLLALHVSSCCIGFGFLRFLCMCLLMHLAKSLRLLMNKLYLWCCIRSCLCYSLLAQLSSAASIVAFDVSQFMFLCAIVVFSQHRHRPIDSVSASAPCDCEYSLFLSICLFGLLRKLQLLSSVFFLRPRLLLCRPALLSMGLLPHLIVYLALALLLFWFVAFLLFVVVHHELLSRMRLLLSLRLLFVSAPANGPGSAHTPYACFLVFLALHLCALPSRLCLRFRSNPCSLLMC